MASLVLVPGDLKSLFKGVWLFEAEIEKATLVIYFDA